MDRRTFIQTGTAAGLGIGVAGRSSAPSPLASAGEAPLVAQAPTPSTSGLHPALAALKPMMADVKPITRDERAARVHRAQQLMAANKISAIFLEGGSSMF